MRKETGFEEVETAGHRIRSLMCGVDPGEAAMSAGVRKLSRRILFFFKDGRCSFFFFSNDPVSREVMMSRKEWI